MPVFLNCARHIPLFRQQLVCVSIGRIACVGQLCWKLHTLACHRTLIQFLLLEMLCKDYKPSEKKTVSRLNSIFMTGFITGTLLWLATPAYPALSGLPAVSGEIFFFIWHRDKCEITAIFRGKFEYFTPYYKSFINKACSVKKAGFGTRSILSHLDFPRGK